MGKYTDANQTCKSCGQYVANHTWEEPKRGSQESNESYEKRRNEAQYNRGKNHDANVKCDGFEAA